MRPYLHNARWQHPQYWPTGDNLSTSHTKTVCKCSFTFLYMAFLVLYCLFRRGPDPSSVETRGYNESALAKIWRDSITPGLVGASEIVTREIIRNPTPLVSSRVEHPPSPCITCNKPCVGFLNGTSYKIKYHFNRHFPSTGPIFNALLVVFSFSSGQVLRNSINEKVREMTSEQVDTGRY